MAGLAAKLHAKNRIWLDESGYAWMLARLIHAVGEDFRDALADRDIAKAFGDAHQTPTLEEEAQLELLLSRLRARLVR